MPFDDARYASVFLDETARFGAALDGAAPDLAVPTCPEWTIRDLVSHVGTGHRWATEIVGTRATRPPPYEVVAAPVHPETWSAWLRAGADGLVAAVREVGPQAPVWTWRSENTANFWIRRMLNDEVIHRFDAELAQGRLGDVAPDLAADGVTDWLQIVATLSDPRGWHETMRELAGTGQTLHLHATDPGIAGEWLVRRSPAGVTWERGHGKADVAVRGPVRELLLVLNRRLDPALAGVEIIGDGSLFADWLAHSQF